MISYMKDEPFQGGAIYEAPRGVCAPLIPENNALISPDPWK